MLANLLSILICLWFAVKLRQGPVAGEPKPDSWAVAKRSLRWGVVIVTAPLLGYFGVLRYMHGQGIPSVFSVVLCTGLTALVMMGAAVELSGNVIVDSLLFSGAIVGACFTVINGVPVAMALLSVPNLCIWFMACVAAAIVVRAVMWTMESN